MFYIDDWREKEGKGPSDDELQRAACALIYSSEEVAEATVGPTASWLRDLIFSSETLAEEAKWIRVAALESPQRYKIKGKGNIFELDPMEMELQEYVKARRLLGLTATDSELQAEACNIIRRADEASRGQSDEVTQFLIRLVNRSTGWLAGFRRRAQLPGSEDVADEGGPSKDPATIDSTVHNISRLEHELAEHVREQQSLGIEPTDEDLQRRARVIIYGFDDAWNQTAADDPAWLSAFKQRHVLPGSKDGVVSADASAPTAPTSLEMEAWRELQQSISAPNTQSPANASLPFNFAAGGSDARSISPSRTTGRYYLSDTNCYQRLARELKKWVAATMSPNNPNCHIPTDEELQQQARWIVYEE